MSQETELENNIKTILRTPEMNTLLCNSVRVTSLSLYIKLQHFFGVNTFTNRSLANKLIRMIF